MNASALTFRPGQPTPPPRRRGFSLLELLAVVTILGILAIVIIPRIGGQTKKARVEMCNQYQGDINGALERYYFDKGTWPTVMNDIQSDEYYPGAVPVCPVDGAAYTIDPVKHRISGHNH